MHGHPSRELLNLCEVCRVSGPGGRGGPRVPKTLHRGAPSAGFRRLGRRVDEVALADEVERVGAAGHLAVVVAVRLRARAEVAELAEDRRVYSVTFGLELSIG